jgi:hypothetical protein
MQYAGMAFQLGLMVALGAFLGGKADRYFNTERPYLTALGVVLFLFFGFYLVLKDLIFNKEN